MTAAYIFIQLGTVSGMSDARDVHTALHGVPGVKTVHYVAGPIDIITYVEVGDQAALMETVGKLRSVKGVASTDTRIVLPL
jgi:DNA-binding Lrp family transcriptional regulator